jgi:hypothetical protein
MKKLHDVFEEIKRQALLAGRVRTEAAMHPKPSRHHRRPVRRSHRLPNIIDERHELMRLAGLIDWSRFDREYGALYAEQGRSGLLHCQVVAHGLHAGDAGGDFAGTRLRLRVIDEAAELDHVLVCLDADLQRFQAGLVEYGGFDLRRDRRIVNVLARALGRAIRRRAAGEGSDHGDRGEYAKQGCPSHVT